MSPGGLRRHPASGQMAGKEAYLAMPEVNVCPNGWSFADLATRDLAPAALRTNEPVFF